MNTHALLVTVSCEDSTEAERIAEVLLKKKLAACTQILPSMQSMYLWPPESGRFEYATEALLVIKTLEKKWTALEKEILTLHSYQNPEIIATSLAHVTKKYLQWMEKELS